MTRVGFCQAKTCQLTLSECSLFPYYVQYYHNYDSPKKNENPLTHN
jgi:hypothetical protein